MLDKSAAKELITTSIDTLNKTKKNLSGSDKYQVLMCINALSISLRILDNTDKENNVFSEQTDALAKEINSATELSLAPDLVKRLKQHNLDGLAIANPRHKSM